MKSEAPASSPSHFPLPTSRSASIGILDSGVGGLSVLSEIRTVLPHHPLLYTADSAWCPYGTRPLAEIQERVFALTDELIARGASLIVIACNSATIAAVEALRATFPIPFVGMEPGIKPAAAVTETGTIGVLATEASLAGEKFHRLLDTHAHPNGVRVITRPCPRFVELVESGTLSGPKVTDAIAEIIPPILAEGADTLVLGCTHYPFLESEISKAAGPNIRIINTGSAVANQVASLTTASTNTTPPLIEILTSGSVSHLESILPTLLPNLPASVAPLSLSS